MTRYPIYIPSKGRADRCLTADLLQKEGTDFRIVVEPQDEAAYAERYFRNNLIVLPWNDPGHVAFARQFIADYSFRNGDKRHWQLDDDVKRFTRYTGTKHIKISAAEALTLMEDFTDRYANVMISGPMYSTYAFTAKKPFMVNGLCASVWLAFNTDQFQWRCVNEDIDYCIQVLSAGFCTIRFNAITCDMVSTDEDSVQYANSDSRIKTIRKTQSLWPGVPIKVQAHGGRINTAQIWRHFKTRLRRVGA